MPIYISNPEAEELARELAAISGETITDVVIAALRDRRDRLQGRSREARRARLLEISDHSGAIIAGAAISSDFLYDADGAPN